MNRSAAPSIAQTRAYGTFRKYSPTPTATPYVVLTSGLHQELPADARPGLVERLGRDREPAVAEDPDQPIPQIAPLEQHENRPSR